jgi:hypothetical protein
MAAREALPCTNKRPDPHTRGQVFHRCIFLRGLVGLGGFRSKPGVRSFIYAWRRGGDGCEISAAMHKQKTRPLAMHKQKTRPLALWRGQPGV